MNLYHTLYIVYRTLYAVHCTLYTVHCTVHCTLYTVHHTLYTVHCTLFTIHCSPYSVNRTLYTVHWKKKCSFCWEKLLKMEVKEHMNKVHHKVPVKSVEFLPGTNGKTEAKTSIEWGNRDKNIFDSSKKEKIDYTYQRVNNKENFKNMDIDSMEESVDEYIPSFDEEDIFVTPPPREKSMGKSQYPFKCKEFDKRFLKSLLIPKHFLKQNMSVFSA